jgi:hypothetical protein
MKRKTTKIGFLSLLFGLVLIGTSFIPNFKADSITETMTQGILAMKIALSVGFVLVTFAVGCFMVAVSAEN